MAALPQPRGVEAACRERMQRIDEFHRFDLRWTAQYDRINDLIRAHKYADAHLIMNDFKEK